METPDQFESSPASSADEILARFERELDESPPADREELLARRERLLRRTRIWPTCSRSTCGTSTR